MESNYFESTDKIGVYFRTDDLFEQLYKKHFKKQYAGKPTKKYLKLTRQLKETEGTSYHDIERVLAS